MKEIHLIPFYYIPSKSSLQILFESRGSELQLDLLMEAYEDALVMDVCLWSPEH